MSSVLPTFTVELSVRCSGLRDKDILSKSDPVCVLFRKGGRQKQQGWVESGRTERVKDSLDPQFSKKFVLEYSFEERQQVRFDIYDWDVKKGKLEEQVRPVAEKDGRSNNNKTTAATATAEAATPIGTTATLEAQYLDIPQLLYGARS